MTFEFGLEISLHSELQRLAFSIVENRICLSNQPGDWRGRDDEWRAGSQLDQVFGFRASLAWVCDSRKGVNNVSEQGRILIGWLRADIRGFVRVSGKALAWIIHGRIPTRRASEAIVKPWPRLRVGLVWCPSQCLVRSTNVGSCE